MINHVFTRRDMLRSAAALTAVSAVTGNVCAQQPAPGTQQTPALSADDRAAIDTALGKKGNYIEAEGVHTVALPRGDLQVRIKGNAVPTAFGFGGWMSIKRTLDGKSAVLMSDTVLVEEEVNPLISAVFANDLEVSAIHNHFFYEQPRIFYMHLHGTGRPAELAQRYAAAIRSTKLYPANQTAGTPPSHTAKDIFDLSALDGIVGKTGVVNGATYKYTVGRDDLKVMDMGAHITTNIGLNTWASFTGEPDAAHVAGDVAMLEPEVNPVVKTLRANGIEVVALHHHMLGESPRIVFLHYYGTGASTKLAQGFAAALKELGQHGSGMHRMS